MSRKLWMVAALVMGTFTSVFAQERNDDVTVAYTMESDAKDVKCEVFPEMPTEEDILGMMKEGRYIMSIVFTKYGTIILHKENTDAIEQDVAIIMSGDEKKELKNRFKQGWVLKYYNESGNSWERFWLFEKNPKVTIQKIIGPGIHLMDQKRLTKWNENGLYVVACLGCDYVVQNGHDDIAEQIYANYHSEDGLLDGFRNSAADLVVSSVEKIYVKFNDKNGYTVIYNRYKIPYKGKQNMGYAKTQDALFDYIKKYQSEGRVVSGIWGGWEPRVYDSVSSDDSNSWGEILGGLVGSAAGLAGSIKGNKSNGVGGTGGTNVGTGSTGSPTSTRAGKCKYCGGSGNCSPSSVAGRKNACYGSKLCGWCDGTGLTGVGESALCTACNGKKKCKTCNGTGKCKYCNGRGY